MESVCHGYIYILLHIKLISCSGIPVDVCLIWTMGGLSSVCHGYICILLYFKLFSVVVLHRSVVI